MTALFQRAASGQELKLDSYRRICEGLIGLLDQDSDKLLLQVREDQEFAVGRHSVNVTILALLMARKLGYPPERQRTMGLAALLHDLGSVRLPVKLLYKTAEFSEPERAQLRARPEEGRKIMEEARVPRVICEIAFESYEREDGSGYPQGLRSRAIRQEALVIGLADIYEALTHSRPHRSAKTGYQVLEEILGQEKKHFPPRLIKALISAASLYPVGEYVKLNTREVARVIALTDIPLRPVVSVLYGPHGEVYADPRVLDLTRNPTIFIASAVLAPEPR
ncbi:MAG: HD domain-containing protein [Acidobacteria bacterium]|nr:HD domain-containing protein [Acidobacteriota bacterium]